MSDSLTKPENPMRKVKLNKVTVNVGVGKSGEQLERAKKILKQVTGQDPSSCMAKKAIKDFGIRKGEPIGCKVTLRGQSASDFLKTSLEAVNNRLPESSFDQYGNFSFGIREHIELPGTRYIPELGIIGMDISITLERAGYRVKRRSYHKSSIGTSHIINKVEAMDFVKQNFNAEIFGDETE
ncbi:50S ribosomal protein L5 [[Eubacterium] cellulosolvens]